ncbi:MAG: hypothetical protein R3E56_10580 [Burkholderiaceae bacterium]
MSYRRHRSAQGRRRGPTSPCSFYNAISGAHFSTASVAERSQIRAQAGAFVYEGSCLPSPAAKARPTSRRCTAANNATGVQHHSIGEDEKNRRIQQSLPQFRLEGVAYYASKTALEGYRPLYRAYA